MKKLTVVIVSYNVCYYVEQCIVSVQRATRGIDSQIYVVDNHSSDNSVARLQQRFGDAVTLIESQHNLGFARANNIAIRQTQSEYVLLLNPDTFVGEESLQQVLRFMDEHPKAGGVGVKMHNADGSVARESRRALPTPWVSLLKMLGFSKRYYMSHLPWDEPAQIDVMSGAFCMLRREALDKVGLLDEDFFMYGEDIDLSYRIKKGGYENWYVPAGIVHYKGESTQKSSFRYVHVFYQAMIIFFRKHYGHLSFFVTAPIKLAIYLRAFIALIQTQYWNIHLSLGFVDKNAHDIEYLLKGSPEMQAACTKLLQRKGLTITADTRHVPLCMVYDTDSYTFEQIIADAAASETHPLIGIYHHSPEMIITQRDVIK